MKAEAHQGASIFAGLAKGLTPAVQISVLLALFSFIFATFDGGRKERLEFVRGQIAKLYGPLYTLAEEHEKLWDDLGKSQKAFDTDDNISRDDKKLIGWRRFLNKVLLPLDDQIEKTLLKSGEIVQCERVRDKLHQFFSFTEATRLVISSWKSDDAIEDRTRSGNAPNKPYPEHFADTLLHQLVKLRKAEYKLDTPFVGTFYWPNLEGDDCASEQPRAEATAMVRLRAARHDQIIDE
jgi:hypothetical protein